MKTLPLLVATLTLLSGCANLGAQAEANKLVEQRQLAAIVAKAGKSQVLITDVPNANNSISDQIIVTSLKTGVSSNSVEALLMRPCQPTPKLCCCLSAMLPTPKN